MLEENENNNNKMKLNHPKKVRKPEAWNWIIYLVCGKICTKKEKRFIFARHVLILKTIIRFLKKCNSI